MVQVKELFPSYFFLGPFHGQHKANFRSNLIGGNRYELSAFVHFPDESLNKLYSIIHILKGNIDTLHDEVLKHDLAIEELIDFVLVHFVFGIKHKSAICAILIVLKADEYPSEVCGIFGLLDDVLHQTSSFNLLCGRSLAP